MSISINEDIRRIVEAELQAGEKLLWADKPDLNTVKEKTIKKYILVFLLLTIVLAFVSVFEFRQGEDISAIIGILVAIVMYGICAFQMIRELYWVKIHDMKIIYGLTEKRIVVVSKIPDRLKSVETWSFEAIKDVGISTHKTAKTYTILFNEGVFKMKDALTIDSVRITEPIETILMKYKK